MTQLSLYLASLLLPQIWAWRRGIGPGGMLALLGLGLAFILGLNLLTVYAPSMRFLAQGSSVNPDPYDIVSPFGYNVSLGLIVVALTLLMIGAQRTSTPPPYEFTRFLAAAFAVSLAATALGPRLLQMTFEAMDRSRGSQADMMYLLQVVSFAQVIASALALMLFGLCTLSLLRALRRWSKRT